MSGKLFEHDRQVYDNIIAMLFEKKKAAVIRPKYVLSVSPEFRYEDKRKIRSSPAQTAKLRRELERLEGLEVLFDKYMTDRRGKYIFFAPEPDLVRKYCENADKMFGRLDKEVRFYPVYSPDLSADSRFRDFNEDDSDHLRILFCLESSADTICTKNISGAVILRSEDSPDALAKLLSCVLTASGSNAPVIFDIADSIEALYTIDAFKEEINNAVTRYRSRSENITGANDTLEITDKLAGFKKIFGQHEKNSTEEVDVNDDIPWDTYYSSAVRYYISHLSLDVDEQFVTNDGVPLGSWLKRLRLHRKAVPNSKYLTAERIGGLDKIGMEWNAYDCVFESGYRAAAAYYKEHGNLECAPGYTTPDGIRLGAWLQYLRSQQKKNNKFLTAEQYNMLNAVGMRWSNKYDLQWDEAYSELCEYYRVHQNLNVPVAYKTQSGLLLGRWLRRQIEAYTKGKLRSDRIERLEKLRSAGLVFGKTNKDIIWQKRFLEAKNYYVLHGGFDIPDGQKDSLDKNLEVWVGKQHEYYRAGKLSDEQVRLLAEIGITFDFADLFETGYTHAKAYFDEYGDIEIPEGYVCSDGFKPAQWLNNCRMQKDALSSRQIALLNELGMMWTVFEKRWQLMYRCALMFYRQNGNLKVPPKYRTETGKDLYKWLLRQRHQYKNGKLSEDKIGLLRQIGFTFEKDRAAG